MRLLLIEDDLMIGQALEISLKEAAYAVDWVNNGETALSVFTSQHYDMVLLDLGLPGKDGIEVLQWMRSKGHSIPLIIITARDNHNDCILGLDGGADDYILKPFKISELLARMRAVLRRKAGTATSLLSNGVLSLDMTSHEALLAGQTPVPLSNREFSLLQALMVRPGAILSRSDLEERIYAWGEEVESNAVEFLIHSLRKKLGNSTIKNVRGVGWMVSKKS